MVNLTGPTSAAAKPNQEQNQKKLKPNDIRYLVMEGGGGKGFAYLGAIEVLEKLKVIENCEGFGGASAGAITATLLSIGYTVKQLDKFMAETDFNEFFDLAVPRKKPVPFADYEAVTDSKEEIDFYNNKSYKLKSAMLTSGLKSIIPNRAIHIVIDLIDQFLETLIKAGINYLAGPDADKAPLPQLLKDWRHYLAYLSADMGLFSGEAARKKFDYVISESAVRKHGGLASTYKGLSFNRHWEIFGKKLLLTGTNLSTGRTQIFSKDITGNFPVADAVRISMGLPWVYKPYVITSGGDGWPPPGVYVDGGVWNNLPFREFDGVSSVVKKSTSAATSPTQECRRATLGLRLEIDKVNQIESVKDLTRQMLFHGVFGSGETQVLDKYVDQMILLDTCGLDLIDFKPDLDKKIRAIRRAKREVWRYFNMEFLIPPEDMDPKDDLATEARRYRGEECK